MNTDLFSASAPSVSLLEKEKSLIIDEDCFLCRAAAGEYNWGNLCCRARFVVGLPGITWRRDWMEYWKLRETPEFYAALARAVKSRWENRLGTSSG